MAPYYNTFEQTVAIVTLFAVAALGKNRANIRHGCSTPRYAYTNIIFHLFGVVVEVLIDTNLLYRYLNLEDHSKYTVKSIRRELNRYNKIYITDFSIYEVFTRYGGSKRRIIKILLRIRDSSKLRVYNITPEHADRINIRSILRETKSQYSLVYSKIVNDKIIHEARLLDYFINTIFVYFVYYFNTDYFQPRSPLSLNDMKGGFVWVYLNNKENMIFKLLHVLSIKYASSAVTYEEFEEILARPLFSYLQTFYEDILQINEDPISELNQRRIYSEMEKNVIANRMYRRFVDSDKSIRIFDNLDKTKITGFDAIWKTEMKKSIPAFIVDYFSLIANKVLFDGALIKKNDMLDSQFLQCYPLMFLTIDEKLKKKIDIIDASSGSLIQSFYDRLDKK